jgi:Flp pilus assembly protein TadG
MSQTKKRSAAVMRQQKWRSLWNEWRVSNRVREDDGQALVEFAINFSVIMGFLFIFVEVCLAFYAYDMISESAREGTRYAIVRGSTCLTSAGISCTASAAGVNTYVSGVGWPNPGGTMTVNTTYPDGNEAPGSRVQVTVTYAFPITLQWVPTGSLTMQSTSVMYIIQ